MLSRSLAAPQTEGARSSRQHLWVVKVEFDRVGVFIAGVQKAGTTSLHSYFAEHPALLPPRKKETHFFDREAVDWSKPDYDSAFHRKFYPHPRPGALPYDATPITIFWPPSVGRILDYNRQAKFIFLFRDPIERAFSGWRMEYGRDAESLSFSAAIREGRKRLNGLPELHPDRRVYSYVERGLYAQQLDRIFALAPQRQLLFLSSTSLAQNPAETLARISDFLSIAPFADVSPRRLFASQSLAEETIQKSDIDYLRPIFIDDTRRFSTMTGIDVSNWLTCREVAEERAQ